ncbi:MAG TPA: HD domain-containing phosphohydrolase [Gemmataceae bacterium]|nr:HD domain-containing phosphohydrolase [Gemmataceae bacterium]
MKRRIRLRGVNAAYEGKVWEGVNLLRTGRLETLEVVLDDASVSRRHAEVRATDKGWHVRDMGSTNGTFLNGMRLGGTERRLRPRDLLQCGKITLIVDMLDETNENENASNEGLTVEASTCCSWEDALNGLAFDTHRCPRPGEQLAVLLRASHHLGHLESEDELLHSILNDAVSALDAQHGAIVLTDSPGGELRLRAVATGRNEPMGRTTFSQKLAQRAFTRGESILYGSVGDDPELAGAQSIHEGAMASVLCVLLRTPRKRLGVLHLDRSYFQKPFTADDLHLADALAASVSAGIESAQLLRKQRDLFLNTITLLAQAVELRDEYTGGHTFRVTNYARMLGQQLNLSAPDLHLIRIGTPLHDIGKIGIDDAILRKPGKLTPEEFKIMQSHTVKGAAILATVPDLAPVIPIVRSHHEKWNGTGYPDGLAGEAIPQLARIVAVADAFDAMTTNRSYRRGMPAEAAFAEVERLAGIQFDPEASKVFLGMRSRIIEEMGNSAPLESASVVLPGATQSALPALSPLLK